MKASATNPSFIYRLRVIAGLLSIATLTSAAYGERRISGTYVSHGTNFAEMLQVTQSDNGQLTGVLNSAELKPAGNVTSEQDDIKGVVDSGQVTINIRTGLLSFLGGTNFSGTVAGNKLQLQFMDSNESVVKDTFIRGTLADFAAYVNQLKSQGARIVLNKKLEDGAARFRQTVQAAEGWITNAEIHAKRIPKAEGEYQKIQDQMQSLLADERSVSLNSVSRGQISVRVNQGDVEGSKLDIVVDQLWDLNIAEDGSHLQNNFAKWDGNCGSAEKLQKQGATTKTAIAWENACEQALIERAKFAPIYKQIMKQRSDLKNFESTSRAHRKALVEESDRLIAQTVNQ